MRRKSDQPKLSESVMIRLDERDRYDLAKLSEETGIPGGAIARAALKGLLNEYRARGAILPRPTLSISYEQPEPPDPQLNELEAPLPDAASKAGFLAGPAYMKAPAAARHSARK